MNLNKTHTRDILKQNQNRTPPEQFKKSKIILHNIRSMHNVGAAFRNADAFGIGEVIISGYTPAPPRPEISKTAIGAEETVPWTHVPDFAQFYHAHQNKYQFIGVEQTTLSQPLEEFELPDTSFCLVFGNEVTGIDQELLPLMDTFVEIHQYGLKHSLNVSVSIGVCLYSFLQKCKKSI